MSSGDCVAILKFLALALVAIPAQAPAALPADDESALRALSRSYVQGWLTNDRAAVLGVMAPEAVFIPHDGVQPKVGYRAIDAFWFPGGKAVGTVPVYSQTITAIDRSGDRATLYGRFELTWQNEAKRFNWLGNFLIAARKESGRWLVTHMMASDADPTVTDIAQVQSEGEPSR